MGPQLYPNAALNTMTQNTTALGVSGTSIYIHHPVIPSERAICTKCVGYNTKQCAHIRTTTAPVSKMNRRPQRSTKYHLQWVSVSEAGIDDEGRLRWKRAQDVDNCVDTSHQDSVAANPPRLCKTGRELVNVLPVSVDTNLRILSLC